MLVLVCVRTVSCFVFRLVSFRFVAAQVDSPLSEQNLPWREKVLVTGPDVMFEVSQPASQLALAGVLGL